MVSLIGGNVAFECYKPLDGSKDVTVKIRLSSSEEE